MAFVSNKSGSKKLLYDEAIELTGFGRYNLGLLGTCCLLILAMYVDIFGFSVALPAVACDMRLSTAQQGLLSAMPLIGVMISSYCWGLCADTAGRRKTLLIAMPVGVVFNLAASMAPTFASLAVLKFLSASFTSSANAAAYVLLGECAPQRRRSLFMFLMASTTMFAQLVICVVAIPVFQTSFHVPVEFLSLVYRPWRLLLQIISLPGAIGCVGVLFYHESPKFLLSKGREAEALAVLGNMYSCNTGRSEDDYKVTSLHMENEIQDQTNMSIFQKIWQQTAPLFKPPLLKNSAILYFILMCAYMTSTGFTMWVPTLTNAYFDGVDTAGQTFCEVASRAANVNTTDIVSSDCSDVIQPLTLYAVMFYSGGSGVLMLLLCALVGPMGRRASTLLVFSVSALCGLSLHFVRIPLLSINLFYVFLHVAIILGNANTYLVELNPTHLRGMATCLSVVVARGFGFFSVQIIAALLGNYCTPMLFGYVALVIAGLIVSYFLPADVKKERNTTDDVS